MSYAFIEIYRFFFFFFLTTNLIKRSLKVSPVCFPVLRQTDRCENSALLAALQAKVASLSLENQQLAQIIKVIIRLHQYLLLHK